MAREWEATVAFLRSLTRSYYERSRVILPRDFVYREFAAQLWGSKSYVRHLAFNSQSEVEAFLVKRAPRHFYYSSARYEQPGIDDMDAKGWRSADIIFDIDADHLPQCGDSVYNLESPYEGRVSLAPDSCLKPAALYAQLLVDVLVEELGFDKHSISVEFSGHRGFHVTVYLSDSDPRARAGQEFRRELVNYVKAIGLEEETLEPWRGLPGSKRGRSAAVTPVPPQSWMAGIRGRIARIAYRILSARDPRAARALGRVDPISASSIYLEKRAVIDEALSKAAELSSIEIDEQVTTDVKRLIRAPLSVHGKTGLLVKPLRIEELESFQLDESLSAFQGDPARVRIVVDLPSIRIVGYNVKLKKGDVLRLPLPLAGYLMAKGLAVLAR